MARTLEAKPYSVSGIPIPEQQPATWPVEAGRAALLVHDMQRYFVGALSADLRHEVVGNIAGILRWARASGVPIVFSAQPGRMSTRERGLLADFWGPGMQTTEEDRAIIPELAPRKSETVITKWRYSAFFKSDLAELIAAQGRDQLIITGIYASVGILATAIDSYTRDIRPLIVSDAVADFSQQGHSSTLEYAARHCARVLPAAEVTANG